MTVVCCLQVAIAKRETRQIQTTQANVNPNSKVLKLEQIRCPPQYVYIAATQPA